MNLETERAAAKKLIEAAFENQDFLNSKLSPEWQSKGWPFFRAIWREAAEGFDHINWEWWKNADPNGALSQKARQQIGIELADILHFGLSSDIIQYTNREEIVEYYVRCFELSGDYTHSLEESLELLIVDSILCKNFNVKKFAGACAAIKMPFPLLMGYYFGKTALNEFRWANGYKEKTYKKMWKVKPTSTPVEDNVILVEVIEGQLSRCADLESFWYSIQLGHFIANVKAEMQAIYDNLEN